MSDVDELRLQSKKKKEHRIKCYKKIIEMCLNKINLVAKTQIEKTWYEIPSFVLGYASFKIEDCAKYVRKKLEKKGFKVKLVTDNLLFIDWSLDSSDDDV